MRILVLEDDMSRRDAMQACLEDRFAQYPVDYFATAPEMIRALESLDLQNVILISLDHDLELLVHSDGTMIDSGDGVDVARWLSEREPTCPVIVHTTNTIGGDRMMALLDEAGWPVSRVVPYDDTRWIAERWRELVREAIVHGADYAVSVSEPNCPAQPVEQVANDARHQSHASSDRSSRAG